MIHTFVFSPTGGTQRVLNAVTGGMQGPFSAHDLCSREEDFSSVGIDGADWCLFAVPSFGGRVPVPAVERIAALHGNGAAAVAIVVYGNRDYDDTFAELQDTLEHSGFRVAAGIAAVAEHSIVHRIASGRPDADDLIKLREFGGVLQRLLSTSQDFVLHLPGNRPYKAAHGGAKPQAGESCTRCGLCAQGCPVGAIPQEDPTKTHAEKCISCMRCVSVCPNGARALPQGTEEAIAQRIGAACAGHKENQIWLPKNCK